MSFYNCSDFAFNFNLIVKLKPEELTGEKVKEAVADWLEHMPKGKTANWVLGNHDNWRLGSRCGVGFPSPRLPGQVRRGDHGRVQHALPAPPRGGRHV